MGIDTWTYLNWEKDKTVPVASRFQPVAEFLGYDPSPAPETVAERLQAKRRELAVTFSQVAQHLGWDTGTLTRYLNGKWRMPPARAATLETFLAASEAKLTPIRRLPKRTHRAGRMVRS
jgi:hypothetical protein